MRKLPIYPDNYQMPVEGLDALEHTEECKRCPLYFGVDSVCMPPDGEPGGLLIVSDSPTMEDDRTGKPIVGDLRRDVLAHLAEAGYTGPVAFDTAIRCSLPSVLPDKKGLEKAVTECAPYMKRTLETLKPSRIVLLGPLAAWVVLGRTVDAYAARRGVAWLSDGTPVFWLPHPKRHRNRFYRDRFTADLKWAAAVDLATLPRPPLGEFCRIVESLEDAEVAAAACRAAGGFTFDVETCGVIFDTYWRVLCTATVPIGRDVAWVWPEKVLENPAVFEVYKGLFEDEAVRKVGQNVKFDCKAIAWRYGIKVRGRIEDTLLIRRALFSDARGDLATLAELVGMGGHKLELQGILKQAKALISNTRSKIKQGKLTIERIGVNAPPPEKKGKRKGSAKPPPDCPDAEVLRQACLRPEQDADAFSYGLIAAMAPDVLYRYNALDAISTARVFVMAWDELEKVKHPGRQTADLHAHYERLIRHLTPTLAQIEAWGMPVSLERLEAAGAFLTQRIAEKLEVLHKFKPGLNPGSNPQLAAYLYDELKLPVYEPVKAKATDGPSVEASVLQKLADKHPFVPALLEWRQLEKLKGTYIDKFRKIIVKGRIHALLNPDGTKTGRLSSSNPNCFSGDTEVLTRQGWVRFDQYAEGTELAQYNEDGTIEFVEPTGYVRHRDEVINISTDVQVDFAVTRDHRMLLRTRKGELRVVRADSFKGDHCVIHAGQYKWPGEVVLTPDEVTFVCAVQADAHLVRLASGRALDFCFRKVRKVERLRECLTRLGIPFRESPKPPGRRIYVGVNAVPTWLWDYIDANKCFGPWVLRLDEGTASLMADEVFLWDGLSTRRNNYTSTQKVNSDWVQILHTMLGNRARMRSHPKSVAHHSILHEVDITRRDYSMSTNFKVSNLGVQDVYCVTVPSSFILTRRNGCVGVAGNCQQIPSGKKGLKDEGMMIKSMFKPAEPDWVMLQLDFSQLELRVAALLCADPKMAEIFKSGQDYHRSTAKLVAPVAWNIRPEFVTDEHRSKVKAVVFGLLYGMTDGGLARRLGCTAAEAARLRAAIFGGFPSLHRWYDSMHAYAKKWGRCLTYWKGHPARRRPLFDIADPVQYENGREILTAAGSKARNAAVNTPVQGSASDFMLMALIEIVAAILLHTWPARLIMSVHDSAIAECQRDFAPWLNAFMKHTMESMGWGDVPIVVDSEIGPSWGELDKMETWLAGYFGLPKGYKLEVELGPRVRMTLPTGEKTGWLAREGEQVGPEGFNAAVRVIVERLQVAAAA